MTAVLVSHPHAGAVSVAAARALQQHGELAGYASGFIVSDGTGEARITQRLADRYPTLANRILKGIPSERMCSFPLGEMFARGLGQVGQTLGFNRLKYDALFLMHDFDLSTHRWPAGVDAVYAYEDGALRTFRSAKKRGHIACVWDLPLPEHRTLARVWDQESARWPGALAGRPYREPGWKALRKNDELELADVVSVASAHTRKSLEEIGISKPIAVAAYGFPTETFEAKVQSNQGPFTVLSVGTHDLRKGTPYLLEAWRLAQLDDARLQLIGPVNLSHSFLQRYAGLFDHIPHVPKAKLNQWYQSADVLAFPTLGDGFGLVIQEAMASATPVITTRMGGGPECIQHGVSGWVIEERSVEVLIEQLRFCCANRDLTNSVGKAARLRAESWTWQEAGDRFVSELSDALARA